MNDYNHYFAIAKVLDNLNIRAMPSREFISWYNLTLSKISERNEIEPGGIDVLMDIIDRSFLHKLLIETERRAILN